MMIMALGLLALVPAQGSQAGVWDKLKFEAEGRMGLESTFKNVDATTGNDIDDRHRGRMRFRVGASYELLDNLDVIGRVSTASEGSDANNPFWDFGSGDGFNGSELAFDRFYLDYAATDEIQVMAGKQPNAFTTPPIYGEFLWDSDVSPSGVAATWRSESTNGPSFDARVAAYVATEVAADEDPKMLGIQGNVYVPIEEIALQVSTALYDWRDNDDTAVAGNQGNSATTEDFSIWETFVAGSMPGGPMDEMTAYIQFMDNLDSSDTGWALGGQLGSNEWQRGNFNAFLMLYTLDGDAVFSPVAQDDTPIAGTGLNDGDGDGMDGVVLGGTYYWRDNVALRVWVLTSSPAGADDDPFRIRFDLDFRIP